jgi:hypothetical protein
MKAKKNLLFIIAFIAVFFVGLVVGLLIQYPPVNKEDLAGTVGKAEKYRKTKLTEKDIQLRSELLKDTAQLHSMIEGLIYFSKLTEDLSTQIETSIVAFSAEGMGKTPEEQNHLKVLSDYSEFVRNNNESLNTTIAMLTGFYLKDSTDASVDIEKNLQDFGSYVANLEKRNEGLIQALPALDQFMLHNETFKTQQESLRQVKSIKDQLVIKAIQIVGIVGSTAQCGSIITGVLSAQEQMGIIILGNEKIQSYGSKEAIAQYIGVIASKIDAKPGFTIGAINAITGIDIGSIGILLVYDKVNNIFAIADKSGLQALAQEKLGVMAIGNTNQAIGVIAASPNMQNVVIFNQDKLNIIANSYTLHDIIQSNIAGKIDASLFVQLFSYGSYSSIIQSIGGFNQAINFVGSFLNAL